MNSYFNTRNKSDNSIKYLNTLIALIENTAYYKYPSNINTLITRDYK